MDAKAYANECLDIMPEAVGWRVYLQVADFSRRNNNMEEARQYYRLACEASPRSHAAWLSARSSRRIGN